MDYDEAQQQRQRRLEQAIQRNADQIQGLKHVLADVLRRYPLARELQGLEENLESITPLDLDSFLDHTPDSR